MSSKQEQEARIRSPGDALDAPQVPHTSPAWSFVGRDLDQAIAAAVEVNDDAKWLDASASQGRAVLRLRSRNDKAGSQAPVLKLYEHGNPTPLSKNLAILERFGLCVQTHQPIEVRSENHGSSVIHEFTLISPPDARIDNPALWPTVENALNAGWSDTSEHDVLCSLVVRLGLTWRQVSLLRAFSKYLRQIGVPLSDKTAADAFANNPQLTEKILTAFHAKFDPDMAEDRTSLMETLKTSILSALGTVGKAEEERVLRKHVMLIDALLRTNYFQKLGDGREKDYLSFKFDSHAIDELPLPRPKFEIFVYASHMEGIHLRGGSISRGGIRWSDRHDDFRTEVQGLLKAQMVKNVVIVPEGSKGGFIVKRQPVDTSAEGVRSNAIACYETLIRGMLDLTDNIIDGRTVAPAAVVCHDKADPYLVVAADKGTATFSDAANAISIEYGFWLDDAFASGGSVGYDHKRMGITARGAWESVKRHFAEMGVDVQTEPFTAIGVGDMSGDVFGNGMLLSPTLRLVGAFDHRHIFIDPDPVADIGLAERTRLFNLPHSSWADYDARLLSAGGAVYDRRAKSIIVSRQVKDLLELKSTDTTPDELIRALLRTSADLLWLGGIGTYIKASSETHELVGDRACDSVRVNASELRCKVIGEGANLGITQQGRIEYALLGGRLNTDAIDNAGGVNCSDHEVNIKILLSVVERQGLISWSDRNALLRDMTDEVADLVLRDNYLQTQALSVALSCAPETLFRHQSLIRRFERAGQLDRVVAGLPDDETIAQRRAQGIGLTRPELAVLLAHTKISLFREICDSDLPDDPLFTQDLLDYFPARLRDRFALQIQQHPLKREIIATMVVNSMVNRVGSGFVDQLQGRTGASDAAVARAYIAAREIFDLQHFWSAVEELDGVVSSAVQTDMHLQSRKLAEAATLWVMQHGAPVDDLRKLTVSLRSGVKQVQSALLHTLDTAAANTLEQRVETYVDAGVPAEIAHWAASLPELRHAADIVALWERSRKTIEQVADLYFFSREQLGFTALLDALRLVPQRDLWESSAVPGLTEELNAAHRALVAGLIPHADPRDAFARHLSRHAHLHERLLAVLSDLRQDRVPTLAMLCVASQDIAAIARAPIAVPLASADHAEALRA